MQASPGYPRDFFNRLLGLRSRFALCVVSFGLSRNSTSNTPLHRVVWMGSRVVCGIGVFARVINGKVGVGELTQFAECFEDRGNTSIDVTDGHVFSDPHKKSPAVAGLGNDLSRSLTNFIRRLHVQA